MSSKAADPLRRARLVVLALAAACLPVASSAAGDGDSSDRERTPQQSEISEDAPVATEQDTVLVEDRLPWVPTSNTIATKLPVDLDWTPANVGVVGASLMREQHALVLGDALENISGLNVQTGLGVFDFFVVRGFDSLTSGLVLTDGAPEPEVTFYQMYNAERVELLKGPGGFLYGANPLAGAVNIVRKQPVLADFAALSATVGSFDTFEGAVDLNRAGADGELSFRLNGLWRDTEGHRDGREGEAIAVNPALTWRPGDDTSFNFNLEVLSSDHAPDSGIPLVGNRLPDIPRERSFASPFDRSRQDIARAQFDFEHRFSDRLAVRDKIYYRQLDWASDGTLLGFVLPTPGGSAAVTRSLLLLDDRQRFLGNQIEILWTARTGPLDHRLLAGLELARFEDLFTLDVALLPPIDLFRPVESAREPLIPIPGQSSAGDSRSRILAPYLIDEIAVSPRFQVLVGARYDDIDFDDRISNTARSDGELSPVVGAVVKPARGLSLYANLARSFAPPSPRLRDERRPERSRQVEVGLRQELLQGRLRATAALFELERENIAIPDDNGFTQQIGDQRARGVELDLSWELPSGLRGLLAYAYTDSELTEFTERVIVGLQPPAAVTFDRSGNRAAFSPQQIASLWISDRFGTRLTLAGGLRYVGEQFIAEDNVAELSDYLLTDLAAIFDLGKWQLSLHLENVTDEDYETRGFGAASVIPGRPFFAALGIRYRL